MRETIFDKEAEKTAIWHPGLQCFVHRIIYEPASHAGFIEMLTGSCCDMGGAIKLFDAIDADVKNIWSHYSNGRPDTSYHKKEEGWIAVRAVGSRPVRQHDA